MRDKSSIPYAGIQTFMGREWRIGVRGDEDVVIVGIPVDSGTSYLPGARLGPSALRKASMILKFYSYKTGLIDAGRGEAVLENVNVVDLGDIEVPFGDQEASVNYIYEEVRPLFDYDSLKIFLGGDHSITYPLVRAAYEEYRNLNIVHIDAHLDILPSYASNKYTHASPIYRIINDVGLGANRIYQLGVRGYVNSRDSYEYAISIGERIYPIESIREKGINDVLNEILKEIGDNPVYITFDADSLDPSIAPGTGVVEPGGFTYAEARDILMRLGELNVIAADFVEVSPLLDHNDITSKTIVYLIIDLISSLKRFRNKRIM